MPAAETSRPPSRTVAPLLWGAAAFALGIVLGRAAWRPPLWWLLAALVMMAAALVFLRRSAVLSQALALAAMAALGALALQGRNQSVSLPDLRRWDNQRVVITGHVTRDAALRQAGGGGQQRDQRQSLDVETEQIQFDDAAPAGDPVALAAGVRLAIYSPSYSNEEPAEDDAEDATAPAAPYAYGQRIRFAGRLHLPRNFGNPGSFDYRQYLADRGISAVASTSADKVERLPGFVGSRWGSWRARLRQSIINRIHLLWSPHQAALLDAMLISERSLVERETRTAFQRSGIYHLLVVAGLHLGIIALFVYWLARALRLPEIAATVVTLLAAAGYAWLADDGAPVWRATLMLAVYMTARLLYRPRAPLNAIGAAALVLLVLDPRALFGASFQLSFAAVLAIAAIAAPLLERTSSPYRGALFSLDSLDYDITLPPRLAQFRLDLRLIAQRVSRFVPGRVARLCRSSPLSLAASAVTLTVRFFLRAFEVLVVSAVMQLALALPTAFYFHRAITVGLPANTLAVPVAGIMLPAAVVAVALSYGSLALAKPAALLAGASLNLVERFIGSLWEVHPFDVRLPTPTATVALAVAAACVFAALAMRMRREVAALGLATLVGSAVWIGAVRPTPQFVPGVVEFTAIDVGQGDSLLVVTPDARTLLVDGGGPTGNTRTEFDFGEDVVSAYLWQRGISRLDVVALTHAHQDHISGLRAVLANFRPRELWLGVNPPTPAMTALMAEARRLGIAVVRHQAGDSFQLGSTQVLVLAPARDWRVAARPRNNDSLAMKISYGGTAVLLAGDAEKQVERGMAQQDARADVLKVAHHGSATSTTPELLAATQPRFAVISAGLFNRFGHPRPEVLSRLAASGVATFRTDTEGAVTFYLDGRTARATLPSLR